ncbi:PAS domain-containing protein [Streptomyces sp. NPDC048527]|uniref:PAS domain-containing protein n=1 Tax=Streptomyces sp. NPDC048527 TaxID=3365568 RepID=UPI0037245B7A
MPAAAFIRDATGRYLWANGAYAHPNGRLPGELTGDGPEEAVRDCDVAQARALDPQVLARGRPLRHSLTFTRPSGDPVTADGTPLPPADRSRSLCGRHVCRRHRRGPGTG